MLIDQALAGPLSFEETDAILNRLAILMRSAPTACEPNIDEIGMYFRAWLDDWDIRQSDHGYATATTAKLIDYRDQLLGEKDVGGNGR